MAKQDDTQYWFKAKRYGWGWGFPQRPQGWAIFAVFLVIWFAALTWIASVVNNSEHFGVELTVFIAIVLLDITGLVYFSFKHGEPPKWRWGGKDV
jgi:hypothetical protein